jgi:hypothetical protein
LGSIRGNEDGHGPSDGFLCGITKEEFRAPVPGDNDAVEVLGKDCVV